MKKFTFKIEKVCDGLWSYTIYKVWEGVSCEEFDYTTTKTRKQAISEANDTIEFLNQSVNN